MEMRRAVTGRFRPASSRIISVDVGSVFQKLISLDVGSVTCFRKLAPTPGDAARMSFPVDFPQIGKGRPETGSYWTASTTNEIRYLPCFTFLRAPAPQIW